ncbi:unnamed protein product [Schistocephalus solidus]|uniref:NR LBD domain-containing protein n=1 Tax=Schistocephalus solidus TaxID=70667 RepID=A0A183SGF4_SCHSO|nr:unnamed protein product [Schistocephalus solidus]
MVSFDVVSLLTSIPKELAMIVIDDLLDRRYKDEGKPFKREHAMELLDYCLRTLETRITEQELAICRREILLLVFVHVLDFDHRFNLVGTEVVAMANTKQVRDFLEAWHSSMTSINCFIDLESLYDGLRARLTDLRLQLNGSRLSFLDHVEPH